MNNLKQMEMRCIPFEGLVGKVVYVLLGDHERKEEIYLLRDNSIVCVDLIKNEEKIIKENMEDVLMTEPLFNQNSISFCTDRKIIIMNCLSKEFVEMSFEEDIETVGWNHTNDYVVIVFKNKTLKIFSFDHRLALMIEGDGNLSSVGLDATNVGWGSASTQFQGPTIVPDVESDEEDHKRPEPNDKTFISWRGNSEAFLINYTDNGKRLFKVFNYNCEIIGQFEEKGELVGPVSWKPQGNVIAAAMFMDNKNCIGLYEKNGLFKMQFPLVDIYCPITFLSWSPCGKILLVVQKDDKSTNLSFYVTSNNRWYLKQHFLYEGTETLYNVSWLKTDNHCFQIAIFSNDSFGKYKFKLQFDFDYENNILAAVNGKLLFLHEFGKTIDPPPSFTNTVEFDNPINMIAFHPSVNHVAVLDSDNYLHQFTVDRFNLNLVSRTKLMKPSFPLNLHHLFWKNDKPHLLLENPQEHLSILCEYDSVNDVLDAKRNFDVALYPIEHIFAFESSMIVHTKRSKILYKDEYEHEPVSMVNAPFPLHVVPYLIQNDLCTFVLTCDDEFYLNEELISKNINSMLVYKDYLFLTSGSLLCSTKLNNESLESLSCYGLADFHVRPINESAHLVCMAGDSSNIILQTPRGNLEIVSCRNMEIEKLEDMLSHDKWAEAVTYMRMSRLNWNLLIDLNPDRFYQNLAKIVFECNNRNILNSIVGDINDENCLNTIYARTISVVPCGPMNKRKHFLNRLGKLLDRFGPFSHYLPTLIKICIDQNQIDKAIGYASELINSESLDGVMKAEQAISLLKIQIAPEELFKAALQRFDIKLADFISKKCQMNPLEVDPVLEELRNMDDLDKRIAVHVKYQNWEEAVVYMLRKEEPDREQIINFIKERGVEKKAYVEALKLKIPLKDEITLLYVERLTENGCHEEAALIYLQLKMFNEAVKEFKLSYDYQKCAEYLPFTTFNESEKSAFFCDFAEKLICIGNYADAAKIHEDQLHDFTTAVFTLVAGRLFKEALRMARNYGLDEIIDLQIIPKMMECLEEVVEQVQNTTEKFKTYCERLKKLRTNKKYYYAQMQRSTCRIRGSGDAPDSSASYQQTRIAPYGTLSQDFDVKSIISTESHRSSRSSGSTSTTVTQKAVRKIEKMKQDISEGSRFEDIALMRELHIMITETFKTGSELRDIFLRLIEYSSIDYNALKYFQSQMYNLQQLMVDEVCNIWDVDFAEDSTKRHINENFTYMDEKYRTIPSEILDPESFSWSVEILKD